MADASGIKAGRAYVELGVSDKLSKGLAVAQKRLEAFGKSVRNIGLAVSAAGAAVTAPIAALAKSAASSGAEMVAMSQRTGISVEKLSELGFAAKLSGSDMETLGGAITKMQRTIAGVADAVEGTTGSLDQLGLSAADLAQLSPDRQFTLIAQRIAAIPNPAQRAAAAMQVFGRSGAALLPMIQNLSDLSGMASELGFIGSTAGAKEAQRFADTLTLLGMAVKSVGSAIGSAVIPVLSEYAKLSLRATLAVRDWVKQHKDLVVSAFKAGAVVAGVGTGVDGDWVLGKAWDGTTLDSTEVKIAKPYQLRRSPFDGNTYMGYVVAYTDHTTRTLTSTMVGGGSCPPETQIVIPGYTWNTADAQKDVIYAIGPVAGGTGVKDSSGNDVTWLDLNVDGRAWTEKFTE